MTVVSKHKHLACHVNYLTLFGQNASLAITLLCEGLAVDSRISTQVYEGQILLHLFCVFEVDKR